MEVKDIINEGRPVEPHSFETDNEEIWYKIGVHDCYEDFCQNRIARSTKVSGEALIREMNFIHDFIKEYNGIPTISDAIEATRKQMVDKACKWLEENVEDYGDIDLSHNFDSYQMVKGFRKAMEE